MNEKVGIRGKFAEQKSEMETDGAWERKERGLVLSFTLRGFMCRRTKQLWKMSTH